MKTLLIFVLGLTGAVFSLAHGGNFDLNQKWVKNTLWALPFGLLVFFLVNPFLGVLAFCLSLAGKAAGHGRGISLLDPVTGEPEKLEILISWAQKYLTDYQYQVLILAVSGLAAVSGGFLLGGWAIPVMIVGGLMKPLSYMLGWAIFPKGSGEAFGFIDEATKCGEFLTGFGAYLALGIACFIA